MFHLLRHADHGHVGKILTGRMPGIHLSETGHIQAEAMASRMAAMGLDALYSSPQPRARETAECIASVTGLEIGIAEELDEIDFGRWAGQTFDALEEDPNWRHWNAERETTCTPAGETMNDAAARLTGLIDRLSVMFPSGSVCLVSHSDVIKAGICRYLGKSFQTIHDFEIAPASVATLLIDERHETMLALDGNRFPEPKEAVP
ncbi:hypothetical protein ATN84_01480 [Paramesorhizobium deserti]|uniref:Phosphoglycerate mutase n=1 Tax=Paramesorhizobium deserti TaxID=1494590 RepID=A0A135HZ53_9HYPH|nr:histidine phosphatase family protein [Paramesorhizobium deserti]KXF78494.1 hypothetical protein ATN84_01480 [Paramesorhizobium deserti]